MIHKAYPKPKRLPFKKDYDNLRDIFNLAIQQLIPDGNCCVICGDNDHQAWECPHNPISIAYQAQHYKCFHCGEIILGDDEKAGEEHFGKKSNNLPKCICQEYNMLVNHLSNLPMTWYPALIIHMVEVAHKKNVFNTFGSSRLIRGIENKIRTNNLKIDKNPKFTTYKFKAKYYQKLCLKLKNAIKGALKIKTCWLPGPYENIDDENMEEARALSLMHNTFESLLEEDDLNGENNAQK